MKLILTFEKLEDKSGKLKQIMSATLRTDMPTGKKVLGPDSKPVDEKLVINVMGEVPEKSVLGKEIQQIIVDMFKQYKKKYKNVQIPE